MPPSEEIYQSFLNSVSKRQWQKFGARRRAGVSTPLFSVYSSQSTGIGEFPDLPLLADWCVQTGMSIIQLLPMNDVGFKFTPYDAQSMFALEPVYLRLENLIAADIKNFQTEIGELKKRFPAGNLRVNYGIKKAKLELMGKIFESAEKKAPAFERFKKANQFWLEDYVFYKVIKETSGEAAWEGWDPGLRSREEKALKGIAARHSGRLELYRWLQWQAFEQFSAARREVNARGVYLMGDIPFLVSRDSADVWARQDYFKLDWIAGAPPDSFFAMGQRWGMPPYNWEAIAARGYDYVIEKLKYAQNFYDFFRIDHVVGAFRIWTISKTEPEESAGLNGHFDPEDESLWEEHGKKILSVMVERADMLPCAEDLGVVPKCSYTTLEEFAIPGMDVQRWTKEWQTTGEFMDPGKYRKNSIAVISNHDMTSFRGWWEFEADTVDGELFKRKCLEKGLDFEALKGLLFDLEKSKHGRLRWRKDIRDKGAFLSALGRGENDVWELKEMYRGSFEERKKFLDYAGLSGEVPEKTTPEIARAAFKKASETASIFSIQLLQDLLDLGDVFGHDAWEYRINFPGIVSDKNWSLAVPVALEAMNRLEVNKIIKEINISGARI